MSGISASGKVMVQEPQRGGFEAHVYPDRVSAAIQLLRSEIRSATNAEIAAFDIEVKVAELLSAERADLEESL